MCFMLPVWIRNNIFQSKYKRTPMLAMRIHFHSKWHCIFFLTEECPILPLNCFLHLPWRDLPKCYKDSTFSYQNQRQFPLFLPLKIVFLKKIYSSVSSDNGNSEFLQRPLECVFPSSLPLTPGKTGWSANIPESVTLVQPCTHTTA